MSTETPQKDLRDLLAAEVRLAGYRPAHEVVDGLDELTYLHSGPPIDLYRPLPAPLVGAVAAGLLFEGAATTAEEAVAMTRDGRVRLMPCQDTNVAGPLTGLVTPRTPMVVVERGDGRLFCSPMHEGDDGGMRTGTYDVPTLERLRQVAEVVAPALNRAVLETPVPLRPVEMQVSALRRGDECHNRNVASTLGLVFALAPALARLPEAAAVFDYFTRTTQHFIAISAAVAKAVADSIECSGPAGLVTAVGMNGQDFGIRVSGLDGWFRGPSPVGPMVALGGADITTASPGQGDSPIIETLGLGAFALSSAPALARTLGFSTDGSRELVEEMRQVCGCDSPVYGLPNQDFAPTPAGIDVVRVADSGVAPATTLGFLSRNLGAGRVGAGVIRMPMQPFLEARKALAPRVIGVDG
ncbi:DUF1116 domain-containing protein [Nocardioides sp. LMS-CY]|uniref:oxamate carbamoyltransferase subunit AllG family protein n=1 Tax=Nocardioides sp. (strain LMS-CY) TaxID=2840457 RepID=UPI001C001D25|nr:DUF1116 domain-containing protein [Nocardioides sp. LMS-CY]QWF20037.1 DUF1116 domain-containing protein [Nocardioides sp. LMS-CY]